MFASINRSLSRQVTAIMLLVLLPLLAGTAWLAINTETVRMESEILRTGELAARAGAKAIGDIIQVAIDNNLYSLNDFLHPEPDYQRIAPVDGDPRFATKYTAYARSHFTGIEDAILQNNPTVLFASAIDNNGHVPATNTEYAQPPKPVLEIKGIPLTEEQLSNKKWNSVYARQGKTYNTALHISAARSEKEILVQPYKRDTGEDCWDIAAPIVVYNGGQYYHYGAFRVGVTRASIAHRKWWAAEQFGLLFILLAGAVSMLLWVFVRHNMRPLQSMIGTITELSTAQDIIELKAIDIEPLDDALRGMKNEIGRLWKALRRLRVSLIGAMELVDRRPSSPYRDSAPPPPAPAPPPPPPPPPEPSEFDVPTRPGTPPLTGSHIQRR